jgi:hypothetical protein
MTQTSFWIAGLPAPYATAREVPWRDSAVALCEPVLRALAGRFAWLGRCRFHSRDYERETSSSEAQIQISMIGLMLRRLAGETHKAPFRYRRPQANVAA